MKLILVGSFIHADDPQDVDLVVDQEGLETCLSKFGNPTIHHDPFATHYGFREHSPIVDVWVPREGTAHAMLLEMKHPSKCIALGLKVKIPTWSTLLALKKAHLISPNKWERHMQHYNALKRLLGVGEFDPAKFGKQDLYLTHRREVKQVAKPHPKLNVAKDSFFEEAEFKIFDHDTVHQGVALGPVPAYTLMQDGEVWCSKAKWAGLDYDQQVQCVVEEASVLALERSVIPALFLNKPYRGATWAYKTALSKICTTITSGWFREFAIENYNAAVARQPDFVAAFFDGVRSGVVKPLKLNLQLEGANV